MKTRIELAIFEPLNGKVLQYLRPNILPGTVRVRRGEAYLLLDDGDGNLRHAYGQAFMPDPSLYPIYGGINYKSGLMTLEVPGEGTVAYHTPTYEAELPL